MDIVHEILNKMPTIGKWQKNFVFSLITTTLIMRSKVNFRNMSRYSPMHEQSFLRNFRKPFDFLSFNLSALDMMPFSSGPRILAGDCSFVKKSGKHTYGLDWFYSGSAKSSRKGLELSLLALVDVDYNDAYPLVSEQTPDLDTLGKEKHPDGTEKNRMDFYLQQVISTRDQLPVEVTHSVWDGLYAKRKFVDGICSMNLHLISKLRHDAHLKYLYRGEQTSKRGRPKQFAGKVDVDLLDLKYFGRVERPKDDNQSNFILYTAVVYSKSLSRNVRVVVIKKLEADQSEKLVAILLSTDLDLPAYDIFRYYRSRFQIEFLFRDAKQHTGLGDCQARSKASLNYHFNASLSALHVVKVQHRQEHPKKKVVFSMSSIKTKLANTYLLELFICRLGFDLTSMKLHPAYLHTIDTGSIAA